LTENECKCLSNLIFTSSNGGRLIVELFFKAAESRRLVVVEIFQGLITIFFRLRVIVKIGDLGVCVLGVLVEFIGSEVLGRSAWIVGWYLQLCHRLLALCSVRDYRGSSLLVLAGLMARQSRSW
jgi:hypothetical protein